MKIALVDDEIDFLNGIKIILKSRGHEVFTFNSPVEALKGIPNLTPDLIVTDVMMPGMHGVDFRTISRSVVRSCEVCIISANAKSEINKTQGNIDGENFFRKPLGEDFYDFVEDLAKKPRKVLEKTRGKDQFNADVEHIMNSAAESFQAYHNEIYQSVKSTKYLDEDFLSSKHWDKAIELLDSLCQGDEDAINRIITKFSEKYETWEKLVEKNISEFVTPMNMEFSPALEITPSIKRVIVNLEDNLLSNFSLEIPSDIPEIRINGNLVQIEKSKHDNGAPAFSILAHAFVQELISKYAEKSNVESVAS